MYAATLRLSQALFLYDIVHEVCSCARATRILAVAIIREQRLIKSSVWSSEYCSWSCTSYGCSQNNTKIATVVNVVGFLLGNLIARLPSKRFSRLLVAVFEYKKLGLKVHKVLSMFWPDASCFSLKLISAFIRRSNGILTSYKNVCGTLELCSFRWGNYKQSLQEFRKTWKKYITNTGRVKLWFQSRLRSF